MPSSVNLGPVMERYVEELIAEGRYGSRSEVLREGVRMVQERETQLAKLRVSIEKSMAEVRAGQFHDIDDVERELVARYEAMEGETAGGIRAGRSVKRRKGRSG